MEIDCLVADQSAVGRLVTERRTAAGLTIDDLARRLRCSSGAIAQLEDGGLAVPVGTLLRIIGETAIEGEDTLFAALTE